MSFEIEEIVYAKVDGKWYPGEVFDMDEEGVEIFIPDKNTSYKITDINNIKKIPEKYQDFKVTRSIPNLYNTNLQFVESDEKEILNKKCFDIIQQDDSENKDYLEEDETENILLIKKVGDNFSIDCFKREYIKDILKDKTKARLFCELFNRTSGLRLKKSVINVGGFVNTNFKFYKLDTSFGSFYLSEKSMREMLNTGNRIFYVKPVKVAYLPRTASLSVAEGGSVISGDHCQKGTGIDIYEIAICGGSNCLPQIVLDEYMDEEDEEDEDEEYLDEDEEDEEDWDPEFDYQHVEEDFDDWLSAARNSNQLWRFQTVLPNYSQNYINTLLEYQTEDGVSLLSTSISEFNYGAVEWIKNHLDVELDHFFPRIITELVKLPLVSFKRMMKILLDLNDDLEIQVPVQEIHTFYNRMIDIGDQYVYNNIFDYMDGLYDEDEKIEFINQYITKNNLPR